MAAMHSSRIARTIGPRRHACPTTGISIDGTSAFTGQTSKRRTAPGSAGRPWPGAARTGALAVAATSPVDYATCSGISVDPTGELSMIPRNCTPSVV